MRKLLFSVLVLSSSLLEGTSSPVLNTANAASLTSDIQMKKDPFKKQREFEKRHKKEGGQQTPSVIGISTYLSAVANDTENRQTIGFNEAIDFNTIVAQNGAIGIDETTGAFKATAQGTYEVTYGVKWNSKNSLTYVALRVNGVVLEESRISSSQHLSTISVFVTAATDSTTFEVINDSIVEQPNNEITLVGDSYGNASSAFITIKKIN